MTYERFAFSDKAAYHVTLCYVFFINIFCNLYCVHNEEYSVIFYDS